MDDHHPDRPRRREKKTVFYDQRWRPDPNQPDARHQNEKETENDPSHHE